MKPLVRWLAGANYRNIWLMLTYSYSIHYQK
jgi:hypothetical protein